jgi:hypothetical protein
MQATTELFVFKTEPEKRERTLQVLKDLQQEIINASAGSIKQVRTFISAADDETVSQIYEWDCIENAKKVFALFPTFNSARELQVLNKSNVFMGQLLEIKANCFNAPDA